VNDSPSSQLEGRIRLLYAAATVLFIGALVLTLTDNGLLGDLMFIGGGICVIWAIVLRRRYLR
jgi:drug/metabolite transporter (DMT)-like permease